MKTSLKRWDNSPLNLTPVELAREYLPLVPMWLQAHGAWLLEVFPRDPRLAKQASAWPSPSEFGRVEDFAAWVQFLALFLKAPLPGSAGDRRKAAERSFAAAEKACKRANRRLRYFAAHPNRENPIYRVILARAKDLISRVLGNFTEATLEHILDRSRPGPGTTIGALSRFRTSVPFKLGETRLVTTRKCLPYARMLVELSAPWLTLRGEFEHVGGLTFGYRVPYEVVEGNRIAFVPKDALTDRTIAVEPSLNVMLQLGVDRWIRSRLKGHGIDLDDQSRNQDAAFRGSRDWDTFNPLVTIDLASASDTVSRGLVERLLPSVWVDFLDCLRSPSYQIKGEEFVEYQKWSSMGNGYTFALESLIFWGLARACVSLQSEPSEVLIYGDDIAVRRSSAALLIEVLKYTGFRVNLGKTFLFGPFRESCGSDFWAGVQTVPQYIRGVEYLRPTDCFRLINRGLSVLRRACLLKMRGRHIPMGLPTGNASGCLWSTDVVSLRKGGHIRWNHHWQSWVQREFQFIPKRTRTPSQWEYLSRLLTGGGGPKPNGDGADRLTGDLWRKSTQSGRGVWSPRSVSAG